jgi:hypothetical protein
LIETLCTPQCRPTGGSEALAIVAFVALAVFAVPFPAVGASAAAAGWALASADPTRVHFVRCTRAPELPVIAVLLAGETTSLLIGEAAVSEQVNASPQPCCRPPV